MVGALAKGVLRLVAIFVVFVVALGAFAIARKADWLSPLGIQSETHDTQVVLAVERTQEVSLLGLAIQGIAEKDTSGKVFGLGVPLSDRAVFLQYGFRAKLGIDGSQVRVMRTGEHTYRLSVPKFIFIGYSQPTFKTATESGSLLSFTTPDIDKTEIVDQILGDSGQSKYLASNQDLLESQATVFYDSLIKSIDPTAQVTYTFSSEDG